MKLKKCPYCTVEKVVKVCKKFKKCAKIRMKDGKITNYLRS